MSIDGLIKSFEGVVADSVDKAIDKIIDLFRSRERQVYTELITKSGTYTFKKCKSIGFRIKGTNSVTIDRFPLTENEHLAYSVNGRDVITQSFNISFSGEGTNLLLVTYIK